MLGAVSFMLCLLQAPVTPAASPLPAPTPRPGPNGPVVVLETTLGTIRLGLHQDKAPLSTRNFVDYVKAKHYDGTIFHRVIPGFMVQGGGMTPDMTEKATKPPIRNEAKNQIRNTRGTVAMARTNDPDSATSQFFVNVKDNHALDFGVRGAGYAVFAEVVSGMDVVDKIVGVPTASRGMHENVPMTPVLIKTARVEAGTGMKPSAGTPAKPLSHGARPAGAPPRKPAVRTSPKPAAATKPKPAARPSAPPSPAS